jgi:hypothetical protein
MTCRKWRISGWKMMSMAITPTEIICPSIVEKRTRLKVVTMIQTRYITNMPTIMNGALVPFIARYARKKSVETKMISMRSIKVNGMKPIVWIISVL